MLDFVLGLYLAGLAVKGWLRGFVRELLDLVGLIVGAAVAFRLSGPVGIFLTDRFGVSHEWGRIVAGVVLFLLFGITMTIVAHVLSKVARLPGLSLTNRVLGAVVSAAWGIVLMMVLMMLISVLPFPDSVDEALEDSAVAQAVAGPDSLPRRLVDPLIGDRAMVALAAIERFTGGRRIVPVAGETVEIEPVDGDRLEADPEAADVVVQRGSVDRVAAGADPLARSGALDEMALERALAMYQGGAIERRDDATVLEAIRNQGLPLQAAAEMVALAATERAAHAGIAEAEGSPLVDPAFDRTGVAVVNGPHGVLVVEIYGR